MACNNDDDSGKDNGGNTFSANFNGQAIEPEWIHGFGYGSYTLNVNRDPDDINDWFITISSPNNLYLDIRLLDVIEIGNYPIESATMENLNNFSSFTSIYLQDEVTAQYSFLSLGNTGSFEITRYDSERGILEGSFSCDMYDPQHPEIIKPISGNFKINMETHPNYN